MHCFEETGSHRRSRKRTRSEEREKVDCTAHRHKRMSTEESTQPRRAAWTWIQYARGGGLGYESTFPRRDYELFLKWKYI